MILKNNLKESANKKRTLFQFNNIKMRQMKKEFIYGIGRLKNDEEIPDIQSNKLNFPKRKDKNNLSCLFFKKTWKDRIRLRN